MKRKILAVGLISLVALMTSCESSSNDENQQAQAAPAATEAQPMKNLAIGDTVIFSSDVKMQPKINLVSGWSVLEPWGVWSDGEQATLSFSAKDLPGNFKMTLSYTGFVSEKHPKQSFEIMNAQGVVLASCDFEVGGAAGSKMVDVAIDKARDADSEGNVVLTIKMLSPVTPKDAGVADGDRLLGMGLLSIKIAE